jgi:DNA-binding transcriptional LysR family regulator
VRIGALPTAALGILPTVIGQFHQQQKDITLQVATMNNTMLLAGLNREKSISGSDACPTRS